MLKPKHHRRSMGWLQKHARFLWLLQRIIDVAIAVLILWSLSLVWRVAFSAPYIVLATITILVMLPIFESAGLYYSYRSEHPAATYPRIFVAWAGVFTLLLLIGYMTQSSIFFSRGLLFSWLMVTPFALCLHHLEMRLLLRQLRSTGLNSRKAVIAGTGELSQFLAQQLRDSPQLGLQFCGFFTEQPLAAMTKIMTKPLIGTLEDLPDYIHHHPIDVVYVALAIQEDARASALIESLQDTTVCVYFVPNLTAFSLIQAKVSNLEGIPLIAVSEMPLMTPQIFAKRLTDIVVSAVALTLAAPLMIAIAIAITLTSPGSIFQRQQRYGFNGQTVTLYKFRTTKAYLKHPTTDTPPSTIWIGAFLKKTRLESLPQLISVLRGHMSIVGPRPQVMIYCEQQRNYAHRYRLGYSVKPGLTGLAQIHGFAGENITHELLQQSLAYDLDYLKNWSLWLDLKIMAKTALTLLKRRRAYS